MSASIENTALLQPVIDYYSAKIDAHGPVPEGVDWNSKEGQYLRFEKLIEILPAHGEASLLDFGCGYGGLLGFLGEKNIAGRFSYTGYDLSESMLKNARRLHLPVHPNVQWTSALPTKEFDYVIASGCFNVKLNSDTATWTDYIKDTLRRLNQLSKRGFAFNALSSYSDPEKQRKDLHYADPLELFDYCKKTFSRFVTLSHDYPLYEFTILVKHG